MEPVNMPVVLVAVLVAVLVVALELPFCVSGVSGVFCSDVHSISAIANWHALATQPPGRRA
jgi:hypothetical protein